MGKAIPKLADLETVEFWHETDSTARWRVTFPFTPTFPVSTDIAAETLSVVYFTLEPGKQLGVHTDSVEEALLIVAGTVEVAVSNDHDQLAAGQMALIPAMAPHSVQNVGDENAQVVGFFPRPDVTSTFDEPVMPVDQRVFGPPLPDDEIDASAE